MSKPERKQYTILNAAYYHGTNIHTVLDIARKVVILSFLIPAGVIGLVKLAAL